MNWSFVRKVCLTFVVVHTCYVVLVFFYIHNHSGPRDYDRWHSLFGCADKPLVDVGHAIDRSVHFTGPLSLWWYHKGFSGLNMTRGVIYLTFGGLQWGLWGFFLGTLWAFLQDRGRSTPRASPEEPALETNDHTTLQDYEALADLGDEPLFVNGVHPADEGGEESAPQKSRFFEAESGGIVVEQHRVGFYLQLRVREAPTQELLLHVECENPVDEEQPFATHDRFQADSSGFLFRSPTFFTGIQAEKLYTIKVSVFSDPSQTDPMDVLIQKVRSYINTTGGNVLIHSDRQPAGRV